MSAPARYFAETYDDMIQEVARDLQKSYFARHEYCHSLAELHTVAMMVSNALGYFCFEFENPADNEVKEVEIVGKHCILYFSREVYEARKSGFHWTPQTPEIDYLRYFEKKFESEGDSELLAQARERISGLNSVK